jgi:hypothetical protein
LGHQKTVGAKGRSPLSIELSQEFLTKSLEISTRSSDSISIVFIVCSLRAD